MRRTTSAVLLSILADTALSQSCPDYSSYAQQRHEPYSSGKYALSYQRPSPSCRTFNSSLIESTIANISAAIADPDLARLFENAYPNTLDTAIKWHGTAASNPAEELTFIITGDIDAMWLRDSTNQLQSYAPLLAASAASADSPLASLYRGAINLQGRYLLTAPFCNSFQAPPESGIAPAHNSAADSDRVVPGYDHSQVFECKYELDSLASFLELSASYWGATKDLDFFAGFHWISAVQAVLATAQAMTTPTYGDDGGVLRSPYTFIRDTTRATETLANDGLGSPVARGTGLVRSAFRPSDDSTIFQFLVPANMMFAGFLGKAAEIVAALEGKGKAPGGLSKEMKSFAGDIRAAITRHGVVSVAGADGGTETVYAYEVDGFGSANVMDDANIPSLLSAPLLGYLDRDDPLYRRTRERILGQNGNPYFMRGPAINAVGGPHVGPGMAWPMASIVRILTSDDDKEIADTLKDLVSTTDGLGLIHESINTFNPSRNCRFSWANGLFGQMIIDLHARKPEILKKSFQ